jgi:hypothetical protein
MPAFTDPLLRDVVAVCVVAAAPVIRMDELGVMEGVLGVMEGVLGAEPRTVPRVGVGSVEGCGEELVACEGSPVAGKLEGVADVPDVGLVVAVASCAVGVLLVGAVVEVGGAGCLVDTSAS